MSLPASLVRSPGEGERFVAGPFTLTGRVPGPQSGGGFELWELELGPATIDYHVHDRMDETITVLEGDIEFTVAGRKDHRKAGSVAFIRRGVHHGFTNPGPGKARVLILFTPAGNQHEYFRELERLFAAPVVDPAALAALQKRYDQVLIPPGQ